MEDVMSLKRVAAISPLRGDARSRARGRLSAAQKKYDPGVTDTEITDRPDQPYSGPLSSYSTQGRVQSAFYNMINAQAE
jgi:hypothetical protein